ncbi:GNAT family N-acetyltransferase (plasmid) [Bradyrhizobium betae]|uniref:GNAT family N-acetyltransferase n=2 Tax=Bradyrhizobium betae TaxID=244734 RepID=A0A5P6PIA6_9BRAD|nr:GNAT family N-acetyltransferase [Bradyrhizobium betae]
MDEREVDRVPDDAWHAAMGMFADVHYEQTAIYGSGQRGERSSHILLRRDGIPFGGARVGLYLVPWIGRGMALVRFAPFWRPVGGSHDPGPYKKVIGALLDEYCRRRKLYLVIRPRPHPDFYPAEAQALGEMGLEGSASSMLDRYFVDATLDEAEQQKSLDQRWRYNLRKGLAHNLDVRIGDAAPDIKTFQDIYAEMVRRKNLNYPGVDLPATIPELVRLPERMKMRIALAYHEGKPIGGLAFSVVGDLAYYVFGATSDEATELNPGYVLQWHVIRWLRENAQVRWYELGGPGDPGIRQFKKGLAGKRGVLLAVREFHYCPDVIARVVVGGLFALRDARNRIQRWQRERAPSIGRQSN